MRRAAVAAAQTCRSDEHGFRVVRNGPHGVLYLLADHANGALMQLERED